MSELAMARGGGDDIAIFRPLTVMLMVGIGIMAFAAMLVLGAYAPDLRSGRNGGPHALSNAAIGFNGIYRLADVAGLKPRIIRDLHQMQGEGLLVASPPDGATNISAALARNGSPTLMILPKWQTEADPKVEGWVRHSGLTPRFVPEGVLAPDTRLKVARASSGGAPLITRPELPAGHLGIAVRFSAPRPLQTAAGPGLRPLITDQAGNIVLGELGSKLYVLADPDLLSNRGIATREQARAAVALLDALSAGTDQGIDFDVSFNGLGHSPSPLKLAFEPPFLAMTLTIAAALLLAGLHALGRFGPPDARVRALAFGKAALVDNTAALVRKARREAAMGGRYAQVIRERASVAFGVPARLKGDAADAYLDRLAGRMRFSDLVARADAADHPETVLAAARALYDWQGETG